MSINPKLVQLAQHYLDQQDKQAFIDQGAMAGGGAPPGGDPSAAGGADPSAGGGAPPSPGIDPAMIQQMVQQAVQQSVGSQMGGGMAAAGGAAIKPKIDVNVTMLQILKILARIADALGVQIPASEMVATSGDLTSMAQQQQTADAGGGAPPQSSIQPIQPMGAASPAMVGAQKQGHDIFGTAYNAGSPRYDSQNLASGAAALLQSLDALRK